jgi:TolB-like protein
MIRTALHMSRGLAMVAAVSLPAVMTAQAPDTRPIVAVWYYDNNSIGKDAADYNGLEKGITDLLITDMASNTKFRVVDRARIEQILQEQNLIKTGAIDPETAVRLGKLLGACYSIYGGFIHDAKGTTILTAHSVSIETGRVGNPEKIQSTSDDVLGIIAQLSAKVNADLDLTGCPKGAGRVGDAAPAQQGTAPKPATMPAASAPASSVVTFAKPMPPEEQKQTAAVKLDFRTALVYSAAIDAQDKKDPKKAAQLFQQVHDKYPTFGPANDYLAKLK